MGQQKRFAEEFEDEAVRLALTSGRTRRSIADDLGIGLSTLTRWIGLSRERRVPAQDGAAQAELKRLRRENEVSRQERDMLKRAAAFFRPGGKSMRFALIHQVKEEFSVQRLCDVLGVSQSGCFALRRRPARERQHQDMVLLAHVRSSFALSNGTYVSPRMTRELRDNGLAVGRRLTARLMRENGLVARQKRRFKRTTDSEHHWPVGPNLLEQDFTASRPDEKWGADISYVWTREGWLYLAVVIDLYARRVVGWATDDRLHRDLARSALRKALATHRPAAGLIHHSGRGS